jgi:hypothetical protein
VVEAVEPKVKEAEAKELKEAMRRNFPAANFLIRVLF